LLSEEKIVPEDPRGHPQSDSVPPGGGVGDRMRV
jgi:hypothetical protein